MSQSSISTEIAGGMQGHGMVVRFFLALEMLAQAGSSLGDRLVLPLVHANVYSRQLNTGETLKALA